MASSKSEFVGLAHSDTNSDNSSDIDHSKTSSYLTTANIVKSFVGLGVLAAPSGFQMVGFVLATLMILINGFINTYTVHLQTRVKEHFGGKKVICYSDLGTACFGSKGKMLFSATIFVN